MDEKMDRLSINTSTLGDPRVLGRVYCQCASVPNTTSKNNFRIIPQDLLFLDRCLLLLLMLGDWVPSMVWLLEFSNMYYILTVSWLGNSTFGSNWFGRIMN